MADVIPGAGQEFWRPPAVLQPAEGAVRLGEANQHMAEACAGCGSEFMIGARYCHTCGLTRPAAIAKRAAVDPGAQVDTVWTRSLQWTGDRMNWAADHWAKIPFPSWLRYLHFHEIKRWVGLPTASLVAFMIGLGCVAGVIGVSLFYKAANLGEFQAIQLWRIEWLLGATAAFVAGILLKKPSDRE
jgi:ribosomal protein L37E